jgi:FAD/FMN-containing dehydrogenase
LFQLLHLAMMLRMTESNDNDVTMTVGVVTVIEEIKEVGEVVGVVDKCISTKTKVRPVSPTSSLTLPAIAVELISTSPIVNA